MSERVTKESADPRLGGLNSIRTTSAVRFWELLENLAGEFSGEGFEDIPAQTIAEEMIKGVEDVVGPEKGDPAKIAAYIKQKRKEG